MNLTLLLRKLMSISNPPIDWDIPSKDILRIIHSFPEPKDDFERSFFQYQCTAKRMSKLKNFIVNFASFILYPYYYLRLKTNRPDNKPECDAVFMTDLISADVIPNSLREEYHVVSSIGYGMKMSINKDDCILLREVRRRYPFYFYFRLKVLMKIAMNSYCIDTYKPRVILMYAESSFATSLASYRCEQQNVKYIGIMHGERLYSLKFPFFRCTKYYAWDKSYVDLFTSMRCEKSQFIVEVPDALIMSGFVRSENPKYDYTFYLQEETQDSMEILCRIVRMLAQNGKRIAVRPHPKYLKYNYEALFPEADIQYANKISLVNSLEMTRNAVSKFSTVLFQAWYQHIDIVIDDCSMPHLYEKLGDLGYTMIKKQHQKLSEIVEI